MSGTGTCTAIKPAEPPEAIAGCTHRFAIGGRWAHRGGYDAATLLKALAPRV